MCLLCWPRSFTLSPPHSNASSIGVVLGTACFYVSNAIGMNSDDANGAKVAWPYTPIVARQPPECKRLNVIWLTQILNVDELTVCRCVCERNLACAQKPTRSEIMHLGS